MAEYSSKSQCGSLPACASCASRRKAESPNPGKELTANAALSAVKQPLFVMSGKGGVGKSAVAANLALALANMGRRVGILDVDIHGPSIPSLLGLDQRLCAQSEQMLLPAYYKEKVPVVSMDSLLEDRDAAIIWRGPKKTAAVKRFFTGVAWGELDYLVIDSPPGTGDEHLAVLQSVPGAQCVMVTTPQEISLADVRKALRFLEKINASLLGIVENMSGLACPHCGGAIDLFSSGGGEALARQKNVPFLGRIPIDPAMLAAADRREPIVDMEGDFPAKEAFVALAKRIDEKVGF